MAESSISGEQMSFDFEEKAARAGGRTPGRCAYCRRVIQTPEWDGAEELRLHFCCAQCRRSWSAQTPSFEVRLEGRPGHRGANWVLQARRARQRDGFNCQVCGISEEELGRQLDVHHKIPYSGFKSNVEANRLENLISVCPFCHPKLEAQLRRELPLWRR